MSCLWPKEEEDILKKMIKAGFYKDQIVEVLPNKKWDSIRKKLERMGLAIPSSRPEINMDAFKRLIKESKLRCL